jgi:hypothetical protein
VCASEDDKQAGYARNKLKHTGFLFVIG